MHGSTTALIGRAARQPTTVTGVGVCIALSLASALFAEAGDSRRQDSRPNIVFFVTDDQSPMAWAPEGYRSAPAFGFCGARGVVTPEIDRLAADGMIFSRAYVSSSVCSPSRYSLLTGRFAGRCNGPSFLHLHPPGTATRVENNTELEADLPNLASELRNAGYRTGFVGKCHLVDHDTLEQRDAWAGNGLQQYETSDDPSDPKVTKKMHCNHQRWCTRLKDFGFDWAGGVYSANLKELFNDQASIHNIDWTNDAALTFLDQDQDRPFFLYYSTTLPHGPAPWISEGGRFVKAIDSDPRITGEGRRPDLADRAIQKREQAKRLLADAGGNPETAWLTWLDVNVGEIRRKLERLGQLENTIIVVTSDHGSWRHGKTTLYEGGVRVPLLVHWPRGIKSAGSSGRLVQNIDLTPTMLELADVRPSSESPCDGQSIASLLRAESDDVHDDLFLELGFARGVVTKDWKYIAVRYDEQTQAKIDGGELFAGWKDGLQELPFLTRNAHLGFNAARHNPRYWESDQLFNLALDPREEDNVASKYPRQFEEMRDRLRRHLQSFPNRPFGEFTHPVMKENGANRS